MLQIKDFIDDLHLTLMYDKRNPKIKIKPNDKEYKCEIDKKESNKNEKNYELFQIIKNEFYLDKYKK